MKASELIKALEDGKTLIRIHHNDTDCKETMKLTTIKVTGEEKIFKYVEVNGWGSAIGDSRDRLNDLILNPEQWDIMEKEQFKGIKDEIEPGLWGRFKT
jgi:hypothetical protein